MFITQTNRKPTAVKKPREWARKGLDAKKKSPLHGKRNPKTATDTAGPGAAFPDMPIRKAGFDFEEDTTSQARVETTCLVEAA